MSAQEKCTKNWLCCFAPSHRSATGWVPPELQGTGPKCGELPRTVGHACRDAITHAILNPQQLYVPPPRGRGMTF